MILSSVGLAIAVPATTFTVLALRADEPTTEDGRPVEADGHATDGLFPSILWVSAALHLTTGIPLWVAGGDRMKQSELKATALKPPSVVYLPESSTLCLSMSMTF